MANPANTLFLARMNWARENQAAEQAAQRDFWHQSRMQQQEIENLRNQGLMQKAKIAGIMAKQAREQGRPMPTFQEAPAVQQMAQLEGTRVDIDKAAALQAKLAQMQREKMLREQTVADMQAGFRNKEDVQKLRNVGTLGAARIGASSREDVQGMRNIGRQQELVIKATLAKDVAKFRAQLQLDAQATKSAFAKGLSQLMSKQNLAAGLISEDTLEAFQQAYFAHQSVRNSTGSEELAQQAAFEALHNSPAVGPRYVESIRRAIKAASMGAPNVGGGGGGSVRGSVGIEGSTNTPPMFSGPGDQPVSTDPYDRFLGNK